MTKLIWCINQLTVYPIYLLLFAVQITACGGGNSSASTITNAADTSQEPLISESPLISKQIPQTIDGQVVDRSYSIRIPSSITADNYPVVFFFHGANDSGEDWLNRTPQVSELIDTGEFIGIFPDAFQGNWRIQDASIADDIEFVNLIVNDLDTLNFYKQGPIYAVGISQGATLVNNLAKQMAVFEGIAPILSQQTQSVGDIVPTKTTSVFQVNGSSDNLVPVNGGMGIDYNLFMSAQASAENWASAFNCSLQVENASTSWSDFDTQKYTFNDCIDNHRVRYYIVENASHSLTFAEHINLYKLIWIFFSYNEDRAPLSHNILSLGDSYTIGQGVCDTCSFPQQLSSRLKAEYPSQDSVNLQIIAQTGWTTTNLKEAIEAAALPANFDLVTLLIGVNNQVQSKPASLYEQEFVELVDTAINLAAGDKSKLVVLSIPDYAFTPFGQIFDTDLITTELDAYNQFAQEYCQERGISYIYITDITRQGLLSPELVATDNLHPSETAYSKFVDRLMPIALDKLH